MYIYTRYAPRGFNISDYYSRDETFRNVQSGARKMFNVTINKYARPRVYSSGFACSGSLSCGSRFRARFRFIRRGMSLDSVAEFTATRFESIREL